MDTMMLTAPEIEAPTEPNALDRTTALAPAVVFAPGGVNALLAKIAAEVRATKTDISMPKGRAAITSLCYKIARSKTALDKMGKDLTDEARARVDAVNAERRTIKTQLEALAEEVRAPLTAWEASEARRIAAHEEALAGIKEAPEFYVVENSVAVLERRLGFLRAFPARDWKEFAQRAADTLAAEIATTESLLAAAMKREAEQAELARLRAEAVERERQEAARQQAEREAAIAAEAAERARAAAEERAAETARAEAAKAEAARQVAERQARVAAEQAEAERLAVERERQAAEERAVQQKARARQAEADRIAAEARAKADAAALAAKVEADRIAAQERAERERAQAVEAERRRMEAAAAEERRRADAAAEAQRVADAKRAANRAHQGAVNREVLAAMVALGIGDEHGRALIGAIVAGSVPHTSITY